MTAISILVHTHPSLPIIPLTCQNIAINKFSNYSRFHITEPLQMMDSNI